MGCHEFDLVMPIWLPGVGANEGVMFEDAMPEGRGPKREAEEAPTIALDE